MKKLTILIGILIMLTYVGLSGCNEIVNGNNKFVGTWDCSTEQGSIYQIYYLNSTMTLFSDGTFDGTPLLSIYSGTWDIKDNKLVFTYSGNAIMETYSYSFSNNDDTLTLTKYDSDSITICSRQ